MFIKNTPVLLILLGTSGAGKTSVLEYLQKNYLFDTSKKYTTRKPRNDTSDKNNFIFCNTVDEFPDNDMVVFQSYGNAFGIQINEIKASLDQGRNHVLAIGDAETVIRLNEIFPEKIKVILLYCEYNTLKLRINSDEGRKLRWETVEKEVQEIYSWLGVVDNILDCSAPFDVTKRKIDNLLQEFNVYK